jgi:hypothetical protein
VSEAGEQLWAPTWLGAVTDREDLATVLRRRAPERVLVGSDEMTVEAVYDDGVDLVVDTLPLRVERSVAVERSWGEAEPVPLVARLPYDQIRCITWNSGHPSGLPVVEVAGGRGALTAWRAGGTPVRTLRHRPASERWRAQLAHAWRLRRERWSAVLKTGSGEERTANALAQYLREPNERVLVDLVVGVDLLLLNLLLEAHDDAPMTSVLKETSVEVTSPVSVRLVGWVGVLDEQEEDGSGLDRARPLCADLVRSPEPSLVRLGGADSELQRNVLLDELPEIRPEEVRWEYVMETRLQEDLRAWVLPLITPLEEERRSPRGLARELAAYLERPSKGGLDALSVQLEWQLEEVVDERPYSFDGLEPTTAEVVSSSRLRLAGRAWTLYDKGQQGNVPFMAELARAPATSTARLGDDDTDERSDPATWPYGAEFVLPFPAP